jgi:hypothetical protein
MLFKCSAWLSEQGDPPRKTGVRLVDRTGAGLRTTPSETARQINCGIEHAQRQRGAVNAVVAEAPAQAPAQAPAVAEAECPTRTPTRRLRALVRSARGRPLADADVPLRGERAYRGNVG